jgi:hypothetical protein
MNCGSDAAVIVDQAQLAKFIMKKLTRLGRSDHLRKRLRADTAMIGSGFAR